MSDIRSLALTRAYELVEAGQSEEARTVLEPVLLNDRDNVDAWWIYAHAVDDPAEARRALNNVLRLDRDYPGASELLATLDEQYPEGEPEPAIPVAVEREAEATEEPEPEFADDESYVEERRYTPVEVAAPAAGARSWLPIAIVAGIIVVLFLVLVLILPSLNQAAPPTPTTVAGFITMQPTEPLVVLPTEEVTEVILLNVTPIPEESVEPATEEAIEPSPSASEPLETEMVSIEPSTTELPATEEDTTDVAVAALGGTETSQPEAATPEVESTPTERPAPTEAEESPTPVRTEEPSETSASAQAEATLPPESALADVDYRERLATALQSFTVAAEPVEDLETEFGDTVLARVCTTEGLELRETLRSVMVIVSNEAESLPENLTGVGVRLINCDDDHTLRIIAVDRETAASYAGDELDDSEFEAYWRAQ